MQSISVENCAAYDISKPCAEKKKVITYGTASVFASVPSLLFIIRPVMYNTAKHTIQNFLSHGFREESVKNKVMKGQENASQLCPQFIKMTDFCLLYSCSSVSACNTTKQLYLILTRKWKVFL